MAVLRAITPFCAPMGPVNRTAYYFYNILGKSLATFGREAIPVPGKNQVLWRDALARKLISAQKVDSKTGHGYWVNTNNRFWEANDVLVTSYTLIALQVALGK